MKPKSHTLFHFTKSRETLQQVLKGGFWPRYCLEDIRWLGSDGLEFISFPMVCFCDIPLSRIDEHVNFYGEFGIGLSKEWAVKNDLNPVLYMASENTLAKSLMDLVTLSESLTGEEQTSAFNNLQHLMAHIKPAEGVMVLGDKPVTKEFYQESEWRYIPRNQQIKSYISRPEFDDDTQRDHANNQTKQHGMLKFVPSDVKYIFVESDSHIPAIINFIQTELDAFPSADLKVLMSRVTSLESVGRDF